MTTQLFVYGTLTEPETQQKVLGKTIQGMPDVLEGYANSIIIIHDHSYPDIAKAPLDSVDGLVITVTSRELELIDNYETDWYKRIEVVLKSGKQAWVYHGNSKHWHGMAGLPENKNAS